VKSSIMRIIIIVLLLDRGRDPRRPGNSARESSMELFPGTEAAPAGERDGKAQYRSGVSGHALAGSRRGEATAVDQTATFGPDHRRHTNQRAIELVRDRGIDFRWTTISCAPCGRRAE